MILALAGLPLAASDLIVLRADQPEAEQQTRAILGHFYDAERDWLPFATLIVSDKPVLAVAGTVHGRSAFQFYWFGAVPWERQVPLGVAPMIVTAHGVMALANRKEAGIPSLLRVSVLGKERPSGDSPWVDWILLQDGTTWGNDATGFGDSYATRGHAAAQILRALAGLDEARARERVDQMQRNVEIAPATYWHRQLLWSIHASGPGPQFSRALQNLLVVRGGAQ